MSEWIKLKSQSCKDCYKCIRHCRVKAIRFSGNLAYNVENLCVLCGHCYVSCPQNAKVIVSDMEKVKVMLQSDKVIALISPTYLAYFNTTYKAFKEACLKLGFVAIEEETLGYEIVLKEYEKILKKGEKSVYISSQCHSVNLMIQKYHSKLLPNLMDVVSPMVATAMDIKKKHPDYKVVYMGPCIAKKDEAERYNKLIDAVLMFDEVQKMFTKDKITLNVKYKDEKTFKAREAVSFGGMEKIIKVNDKYDIVSVSDVDSCRYAMNEIERGNIKNAFVIMDMCKNSCLSGPTFLKLNHDNEIVQKINMQNHYGKDVYSDAKYSHAELAKYFDEIKLELKKPSKEELQSILASMGKDSPEKILNCGVCGYSTCVNKAIAIYNGMAEPSMCVSYMTERAESFSDNILQNSPFAVIAINDKMEVQVFNNRAKRLFNIHNANDIMGHHLSEILDTKDIESCYTDDKDQFAKELYLSEYDKYIEEIIVPDKKHRNTIIIIRDLSDVVNYKKKIETIDKNAIEIADNVIEKQMKIVQEIASLLGETTAETKVALTKLKESLSDE
ncbi:MAG: histidine kinase [Lachnospiraceae bacterium]|nr:histidine kinase [Lachnospiraceae bacterium]